MCSALHDPKKDVKRRRKAVRPRREGLKFNMTTETGPKVCQLPSDPTQKCSQSDEI